jgi:Tfp pilus assembly protein PilV
MTIEERQLNVIAQCFSARPYGISQFRASSGFVLVELLIAICVVTASLAGIFALSHQSMRIVNDMKNETCAAQIAESEMERLRAMSWNRLAAMDSSFVLNPNGTPGLAQMNRGKAVVRIQAMPGETEKDKLRAVSVRITWFDRDGRNKELALATLMTPRRE